MDIIYFQPLTELEINIPGNWYMETVVSISAYGHSIGFLMGSFNNEYFGKLSGYSSKAYTKKEYQCMGSALCNFYYPTMNQIPGYRINLGMDAVYTYNADNVNRIFKENFHIKSKNAIGLHWYAGHPMAGRFLNKTDGGRKDLPICTLTNLITPYINDKES
jgi:hypothetical protein